MINIIDTRSSNLMSLVNALSYLNIKNKVTKDINDLNNSIILLKQIFEKSNLNEIKIIDLRLKNKIIIS